MNRYCDDYLSHLLLYKLIEHRSKSNKLYMKRSLIYKQKKATRPIPKVISISLKTIINNKKISNERYLIALVSINQTSLNIVEIHDYKDLLIQQSYKEFIIDFQVDPIAFINKDKYDNTRLLFIITTTMNESSLTYYNDIEQKLISFFEKCIINNNNEVITESLICLLELSSKTLFLNNNNDNKLRKYCNYWYHPLPSKRIKVLLTKITTIKNEYNNNNNDNDNISLDIVVRYKETIERSLIKCNRRKLRRKLNISNTEQASIFFHYVFKNDDNNPDGMIESIRTIVCPFCEYYPCQEDTKIEIKNNDLKWTLSTERNVNSLVEHMQASHSHFKYCVRPDRDRNLHIILVLKRNQGKLNSKENLINFSYSRQNTNPKKFKFAIDRQVHHSSTGQLALEEEFAYDSDDDIDTSKRLMQVNLDIAEFEDISQEEKLFMSLWNIHINSLSVFADCYMMPVCELFVRRHADYILKNRLRHNLLLHLINLYDCNLLRSNEILPLMAEIDLVQANDI